MERKFKHIDLKLVSPSFESNLTNLIIDLDSLRKKSISITEELYIFLQLKNIFHILESIASTRIEGNNTTLAEYIDFKIDSGETHNQTYKEIQNLEDALGFIEKNTSTEKIGEAFISELHKLAVKDLPIPPKGEGDKTPGKYRQEEIRINKSNHIPPPYSLINSYMGGLVDFINKEENHKYDLMKIAIIHHRFTWIHPFFNGNGRAVRLLTYALLIKYGFHVNTDSRFDFDVGRILNPTAIFCNDRESYYNHLSLADTGDEDKMLVWCEYVLNGLKEEIEKIDKLLDFPYLKDKIIIPAIEESLKKKYITGIEAKILRQTVEKKIIVASMIKDVLPGKNSVRISQYIRKLIDKKMLLQLKEGGRKYVINFTNNYLTRGIALYLNENGFVPLKENKKPD